MDTMAIYEAITKADEAARNRPERIRYGQAFMNALPPLLYGLLSGSPHDPFYQDGRMDAARQYLYDNATD